MSLLRNALPLLLITALAGCGFSPVYGKHSAIGGAAGQEKLAQVKVQPLYEREGQILRIALEDKLNPKGLARPTAYSLQIGLTSDLVPIVVQIDRSVARYTRNLYAHMTLVRLSDNKTLLNNSVRRTASYNVSPSDFATYVASQDTVNRAAEELAADIALRVADALSKE